MAVAIDHRLCAPAEHDRSLPDDTPEQTVAGDGLLGCNDCGKRLFYCTRAEDYRHVDPLAECWLVPAWD